MAGCVEAWAFIVRSGNTSGMSATAATRRGGGPVHQLLAAGRRLTPLARPLVNLYLNLFTFTR
jgi:hypothetical protein